MMQILCPAQILSTGIAVIILNVCIHLDKCILF